MLKLETFTESDIAEFLEWFRSTDAEFLLQFGGPKLEHPLDEKQLLDLMKDPTYLLLKATENESGMMSGHIQLMRIDPENRKAFVGRVLIKKEKRGLGYCEVMLNRLMSYAANRLNLRSLDLNVYDWNTTALNCYKKSGFTEIKRESIFFPQIGKEWNSITMRREIVPVNIRKYRESDAEEVNRISLAAFSEFAEHYSDWPSLRDRILRTSSLAEKMDFFIAEDAGKIAGSVGYTPPFGERPDFFDRDSAIIRMLVVDPEKRGMGIGSLLVDRCVERAREDGVKRIQLHTSEAMNIARPMYLRRGFVFLKEAPSVYGLKYGIYELSLKD